MMKHRIYILLLLGALASGALFAQAPEGNVSVGPQVGFFKTRGADDTRVMGGAALRFRFSGLGAEASINYREENFDNDRIKVRSYPVMFTGLFYPLPVLYGAVGAGWYHSTVEYNYPTNTSSQSARNIGWHFGGGLEIPLGSAFKLTGDIRYVFLDYDFDEIPGINGLNSNFSVISAGLLFSL